MIVNIVSIAIDSNASLLCFHTDGFALAGRPAPTRRRTAPSTASGSGSSRGSAASVAGRKAWATSTSSCARRGAAPRCVMPRRISTATTGRSSRHGRRSSIRSCSPSKPRPASHTTSAPIAKTCARVWCCCHLSAVGVAGDCADQHSRDHVHRGIVTVGGERSLVVKHDGVPLPPDG